MKTIIKKKNVLSVLYVTLFFLIAYIWTRAQLNHPNKNAIINILLSKVMAADLNYSSIIIDNKKYSSICVIRTHSPSYLFHYRLRRWWSSGWHTKKNYTQLSSLIANRIKKTLHRAWKRKCCLWNKNRWKTDRLVGWNRASNSQREAAMDCLWVGSAASHYSGFLNVCFWW